MNLTTKPVYTLFFLFFFSTTSLLATVDNTQQVEVDFYGEKIQFTVNQNMLIPFKGRIAERALVHYYKELAQSSFTVFLAALDDARRNFQLNDWLYYKLMKAALEKCTGSTKLQIELTSWFLLSQKGWNTRLAYTKKNVFVYVFTNDELFEVPMIDDENKTFVNLSGIGNKHLLQQAVYMLNFTPMVNGQSFSFYLKHLPQLKIQKETRTYHFEYEGQTYEIEINVDENIKNIMKDYPVFSEKEYLEVPFSATIQQSLIPQFEILLKDKSNKEALQLLVAFTRSSFRYKRDQEYFGQSKPMIAEEIFHYPFSDCEDRSALFYSLVKELLDLPMIIIAYPDHLTIAVAFDNKNGDVIKYKGKEYFLCDPTGPINSTAIGRIPKEFVHKKFEIIGSYK